MVDSKQQWKAWLYLSPAIVLLLVFTVWPIVNTVLMAFQENYNALAALDGATYTWGIGNFKTVLKDPQFLEALKNTLLLCIPTVLLSTFLALVISVCLNAIKPLQRFLQTIFFLPYVTNSIAIGMVFAAMFSVIGVTSTTRPLIETTGIINIALDKIGLLAVLDNIPAFDKIIMEYTSVNPETGEEVLRHFINWIGPGSNYWVNMFVMIVYIVWNALPFKILILLGGLQSVNKQYYDAAKVDGTGKVRTFTRITVPLLSPMITYVVITGFIGGFKEYTSIVGIFGDKMKPIGSRHTLNTMVGLIYDSLEGMDTGMASASALILFVIIFVITMINLKISNKTTHY
jgi:multiple sugar transport system permease protein